MTNRVAVELQQVLSAEIPNFLELVVSFGQRPSGYFCWHGIRRYRCQLVFARYKIKEDGQSYLIDINAAICPRCKKIHGDIERHSTKIAK